MLCMQPTSITWLNISDWKSAHTTVPMQYYGLWPDKTWRLSPNHKSWWHRAVSGYRLHPRWPCTHSGQRTTMSVCMCVCVCVCEEWEFVGMTVCVCVCVCVCGLVHETIKICIKQGVNVRGQGEWVWVGEQDWGGGWPVPFFIWRGGGVGWSYEVNWRNLTTSKLEARKSKLKGIASKHKHRHKLVKKLQNIPYILLYTEAFPP